MQIERWARVGQWSPGSPKQVLAYLKSKGYPIPKHKKTKKPTCDDDALERLLRKYPTDPIIPQVRVYKSLQKASGYLSDSFVGLDERFHSEFTRHPATMRLSSRRPNLTNQPNPDRQQGAEALAAKKIRGTIIASPGMILLERDYRAQESQLTGWFAGDEDYMRLARLDIYSYFVAKKVGRPIDLKLSDKEVALLLKAIKGEFGFDRQLFKVIILALGYGEGQFALSKQLEPFLIDKAKIEAERQAMGSKWWSEITTDPLHDPRVIALIGDIAGKMARAAAKDYRSAYEAAAPKVVRWQEETRKRAHKEKRLVNPFGMAHDFFDVFTKRDGEWKLGSEANLALAYLPQSTGAGMLMEALLALDAELGNDPDFHMLVPVHDAIFTECKESKVDNYSLIMKQIMEAPIPALGGLSIETEAKVGYSWAWEEAA